MKCQKCGRKGLKIVTSKTITYDLLTLDNNGYCDRCTAPNKRSIVPYNEFNEFMLSKVGQNKFKLERPLKKEYL